MSGFLADVLGGGCFGLRCHDRRGEGVRRLLLNRRREGKHLRPIESVCRDNAGNLGLVAGKGSSLVHRQVTDATEPLERRAGLDDHAELAGRADRGHDCQWHGDCQRARRRCDQDHQRSGDPRLGVAQQRADHADQHRQNHHPGHEGPGNPVGDPGAVTLLRLRLLDKVHECGQRVVRSSCGRLDLQHTAGVDRSRGHLVAGCDLLRNGFPGDR